MKISIIGQGYVGLPLAMAAVRVGHKVLGFDLNEDLVKRLNLGFSHVEDIESTDLAEAVRSGKYHSSSDPNKLRDSEIVIIAVPTPLDQNRIPDLSFIKSASTLIGANLGSKALIINESTSYPGTLRELIAPTVRQNSRDEIDHLFSVSPERVDPGNKSWNIERTPRLYAGLTPEAAKLTKEFYSGFCDKLIAVSSPEVAETAKLFENTFRQVNIALVNELALITRAIGISVNEVIEAASSKPYGFMKFSPGIGVGGHCIPVDPSYLAYSAKKAGVEPRFIELANSVNLQMPKEIVHRIKNENSGSLKNKSVLVCGISYKTNVADVRETPSAKLIDELREEGANVFWHDPLVSSWQGEVSTELTKKTYDVTIVAVLHEVMDKSLILNSSDYLFDCTGQMPLGHKL